MFFFFFSSRRRHTRWPRDWSSDVCSSDLMADRSVKEGRWEKKGLEGRELHGKVLGLLGSGRIGGEVAKRAHAFGMAVIAFDPYLSLPTADSLGIRLVDKASLFRDADVVSVHAALTPETKGLVGRPELALMKRTGVLVK